MRYFMYSLHIVSCMLAFNFSYGDTRKLTEPLADHSASSPLNDTGITWHGTIPKGVNDNCDSNAAEAKINFVSEQDCFFGRDAKYSDKNTSGFTFTKLNENGKPLSDKAKNWLCVQDNISGLIWEVKQEADLHKATDLYTWYNSDKRINAGAIGDWNSRGNHCFGYQKGKPRTFCHTEQYISRVNQQGLCGFDDWRLPTRSELVNLLNFGQIRPAIETHYFPNAQSGFYWTATPTSGRTLEAWAINFEYGFSSPMPRSESKFVRLVRDFRSNSKNKQGRKQ